MRQLSAGLLVIFVLLLSPGLSRGGERLAVFPEVKKDKYGGISLAAQSKVADQMKDMSAKLTYWQKYKLIQSLSGLLNHDITPEMILALSKKIGFKPDRKHMQAMNKRVKYFASTLKEKKEKASYLKEYLYKDITEFNKRYQTVYESKAKVLDIDRDNVPDMIIIPNVYFGPSPGDITLIRNGPSDYTQYYSIAGEMRFILRKPQGDTLFYYNCYTIESESEPLILYISYYHKKFRAFSLQKTYYFPGLTLPKMTRKPVATILKSPGDLRYSPKADNSPSTKKNSVSGKVFTIRGNVFARLKGNAKAYIIARQGRWQFVAVDSRYILNTTLYHGMDEDKSKDPKDPYSNRLDFGKVKKNKLLTRYVMGWVYI
ncbi:MAG: hypothetical protein OEZ36_06705 [Spirochaetota bacterium]|nr:hypothetical protein [Spirochaetota bacterium]